MSRILYGVSPIGLGHATRALVLVSELRKHGAEVRLFSGGRAAEFLLDRGEAVESIVIDPVPDVVDGEMRRVALWYIRSWFAYKRTIGKTERLFDEYRPDLVVCDEEFTGLAVAQRRGVTNVFISDELILGFARSWISRQIELRVERWYRGLQDTVDLLVVPELGEDAGNRRFVGPIVRSPTMNCAEVRKAYGLPEGRMVLFSMSGSGLGRNFVDLTIHAFRSARIEGSFLVVVGNRGPRFASEGVFDLGLVPDGQNLVACADLVVTTAGKSTIDEAQATGTPIVAIPIRYHAEQERNAAALGFSFEDSGRLAELLVQKIGRREAPRQARGAEIASRLILASG